MVMVGRYRPVYDLMGHGRGLVQMVECIQGKHLESIEKKMRKYL